MAITTSAKKAHRQSKRKKVINDRHKLSVRMALKNVRLAQKGDMKALAAAYKAIDKATKHGLLKKNTAARRKSKVSRTLRVS